MTLDQYIESMEAMRLKHGGDVRVVNIRGGELREPDRPVPIHLKLSEEPGIKVWIKADGEGTRGEKVIWI